jgi:hypothetical protein
LAEEDRQGHRVTQDTVELKEPEAVVEQLAQLEMRGREVHKGQGVQQVPTGQLDRLEQ